MEAINRGVGKHKGFFYLLRPLQASPFQSTVCILQLALLKTILVPSTQPEAAHLPPWASLLPLPYQCYTSHWIDVQSFVFCMAEMYICLTRATGKMHMPIMVSNGHFTHDYFPLLCCKNHPKTPQILCQE